MAAGVMPEGIEAEVAEEEAGGRTTGLGGSLVMPSILVVFFEVGM